jgi:putative spermidine/putrescine transport system substrate-binding protein
LKKKVLFILMLVVLLIFGLNNCKKDDRKGQTPPEKKEIVVLSYGGAFASAQRIAYYKAFEKETGIKVVEASYNGEYGKLKAMVMSGNVTWDVCDVEAAALMRGIKENLYMPIDYKVIDTKDMIEEAVHEYGVGTDLYSVSLGFNTDTFPSTGPQPKDWKDFWDTKKFPGPRCMKKDPKFTLEIALMADGVPADQIYTEKGIDLDRAFKSLDKIKSHVKVWWTTGHQPIQLLSDGEIALAAAFGARLWIAKNNDKKPVTVVWNQSITDIEYWSILRGAKNPKSALKYIAFASRADRQAEFSRQFPLGPANKKAFDHLEPQFAKELNTYPENFKTQLILNAKWWSEHESEITEKWNAWLLK